MASENRLNVAAGAFQRFLSRVAARIAELTFWQFALLAVIVLAAAAISENLFHHSGVRRIRITGDQESRQADKLAADSNEKHSLTAEIRIDENGVVVRRKADPNHDSTAQLTPKVPADKETPKQSSGPDTEELRSGKDLLVIRGPKSGGATDGAGGTLPAHPPGTEEITVDARPPQLVTLALLLVLILFVIRMFARAQLRAEKKAAAAMAVAEREALQRQVAEARLQLLQAQVEPHFLFNTLAAVEHLIETAPARAAQMQKHLIQYLRAAVPRMRQQSASLGQEVDLCVSYLKIMQMRMEERLRFDVAVPSGLNTASFPPMMIQSLIENAIRHGLEPKPEGGSVNLGAEVRDGKLCVTVEDSGLGFSPSARTGIGLANIRERLEQMFGADGSLVIEPNQPSGTRATITVPYALA